MCHSPNPQKFRMCLCLKTSTEGGDLAKNKASSVDLHPVTLVSCQNTKLGHTEGHKQSKDLSWTQCEGAREQGSGETSPADTSILDFSVQNCVKMAICGLSVPVWNFVIAA